MEDGVHSLDVHEPFMWRKKGRFLIVREYGEKANKGFKQG